MQPQPKNSIRGLIVEDANLGERTIGGFTFEQLRCLEPYEAAEQLVRNVGSGKKLEDKLIEVMREIFPHLNGDLMRRCVLGARDFAINNV